MTAVTDPAPMVRTYPAIGRTYVIHWHDEDGQYITECEYRGMISSGAHVWVPTSGYPHLFLFPDEILSIGE